MTRPGALPIAQQIIVLVVGPPVMAGMWWALSRGWAGLVQGGDVSGITKKRQKWEFWIILAAMYVLGFGLALYAYVT